MLRPVCWQCPAKKSARALQPDSTNMMCIKIKGTTVALLTRASFFLSHYMLPPADKGSVQVARATYKAQSAGLFKDMQRQMTETLVDNELGIL